MKIVVLLLLCATSFALELMHVEAGATILDYTAEPEPEDTFEIAQSRIYIPDGIPQIRGRYFRVAPYLTESRPHVENPTCQTLGKSVQFGVMGVKLDNLHMDSGIGSAVLHALSELALA